MPVGREYISTPSTANPFARNPEQVCLAELCVHNRPETCHIHRYIQIWYTRKGSYLHRVGSNIHTAGHGTIIIIPPYTPHSIDTSTSFDTEIICLTLLPSNIMKFWNVDGLPAILSGQSFGLYFLGEKISSVTQFDGEFREYADYIFSDLYDCCQKYGDIPVNMCIKSLFGIFCAIPKNTAGEQLDKKKLFSLKEKLHIIEKSTSYIATNYREQITINDMLSVTSFSKTAFSSAFREITGLTFSEYLSRIRLHGVTKEIAVTDHTLSEIAEKYSYANKSHLIRQFKDTLSVSTSEYKISSRKWFRKYAPHWLPDELRDCNNKDSDI